MKDGGGLQPVGAAVEVKKRQLAAGRSHGIGTAM